MITKIWAVTVVLLLAVVAALASGSVASALSTTALATTTACASGFLGMAGLGLKVLDYLLSREPRGW